MNPVGILLGLTLAGGLLLVIRGLTPQPVSPPKPPRSQRKRGTTGRRDLVLLVGGAAAGLVISQLTGLYIAVVVVPVALWGTPKVMAPPGTDRTDLLDALASWTQGLAAMFQSGTHLTETLRASRRSAAPVLHEPLDLLLDRLDAGQPTKQALYSFADDLNDETGDLVAGALIAATDASTSGLGQILPDVAEMTAHEVRQRREITAAQNAPRNEARWCAIIAVVGIGGLLLLPYGQFYIRPAGQLLLLALLCGFAAVLWWMRQIATTPPSPRFLVRPQRTTEFGIDDGYFAAGEGRDLTRASRVTPTRPPTPPLPRPEVSA